MGCPENRIPGTAMSNILFLESKLASPGMRLGRIPDNFNARAVAMFVPLPGLNNISGQGNEGDQ